jgi:hypothetical protein
MTSLPYAEHAPAFLRDWFVDLEMPSRRVSDNICVIFSNPRGTSNPTIVLPVSEWLSELEDDGSSLDQNLRTLAESMSGSILVYPWNIHKGGSFSASFGVLSQERVDSSTKSMPGFYVDIQETSVTGNLSDAMTLFCERLSGAGIEPSLVTRTFGEWRIWRLWWKLTGLHGEGGIGTFTVPQLPGSTLRHLAWGRVIQRHAERAGLVPALDLNPRFELDAMLYPLPGVGAEIIRRADVLNWGDVGLVLAQQELLLMEQWTEYGPSAWAGAGASGVLAQDALRNTPWDDVLRPMGWSSMGRSTDGKHFWQAPGRVAIGTTTGQEMRLWGHDQSELSGLKEVSDAGIALDKRVVACLVGWDGDREAFLGHWARTGTLYW